MEEDLDFLITALSRTSSPLRKIYSHDQLMDMRDSFITLQDLLRKNPINMENIPSSPLRVKAGGNTDWNVPRAREMPKAVPLMKLKFNTKKVQTSFSSVRSINDIHLEHNRYGNKSIFEPLSDDSQDDRGASCSDNFQAVVPYQEEKGSQELVRYTPPSESEDDELLESETLCANANCGNASVLSFRIPMEMECVWCNGDFNAESTESEMTIIADGCNFILSN